MIHPTAIIHPKAKLDSSVKIGPYVVIDEGVEMGPECVVGPHVYITGLTKIGARNRFHAGCVIGDEPQDLKYKGEPTRLRIGDDNVFHEHMTVNRSTTLDGETVVGSNNFLMQHSHIAHNCAIGNRVILAGGALLAGHVTVQDGVFISGNCIVHQFVRIGTLAMMQGGSGVSMDLPPYTIAQGANGICGLNVVGLRRVGMSPADRLELKQVYKALFRSGQNMRAAVAAARGKFKSAAAITLIDFVAAAKRGVCSDTGAIRSREKEDEE